MPWVGKKRMHQISANLAVAKTNEQVLASIPTPVMAIDTDFNVTYLNEQGANLLKKTARDCLGKKCYSLFKTDHCNTGKCCCKIAMTTKREATAETVADPKGLNLPIRYSGSPLMNEEGRIAGAVEYIVDISDSKAIQKQADEKISYLDGVPTPIMAIDKEYNVIFLNKAGIKAVNSTAEEVIGKKCYSLFNTHQCNTEKCALHQAMKNDNVFTEETVAQLPGGDTPIRYSGIPLKNEQNTIVGAVEFVMDMTEITGVVNEVNRIADLLREGQLQKRARTDNATGQYKQLVDGFNSAVDNILKPVDEARNILKKMAKGDLSKSMTGDYKGDHAVMKEAVNATLEALNDILAQVNSSVEQVSSGAQQVSDSSQSLSQGATEQASSLEEITASMTQIGAQTRSNAENASQANRLADGARQSAEDGNQQMKQMIDSMKEIQESSKEINRIIKVIDEIAFQTNLLALNAAVEAARAGVHGKGFAVVADEVRNLAKRSATAAKETTDLINDTSERIDAGAEITVGTAKALTGIADNVIKLNDIIKDITASSDEQSTGINQINDALGQIDSVTQANTSNAEEGAAAAEELSSQAVHLQQMIARFKLRDKGNAYGQPAWTKPQSGHPTDKNPGRSGNGNGSGNGKGRLLKGKADEIEPSRVINLEDDIFSEF